MLQLLISFFLSLKPYTFPPLTSAAGYEIQYAVRGRSSSLVNTDHSETQYTIRGLQANVTYTARIRARFHFSEFCISRSFRTAEWSTRVSATTVETGILLYIIILILHLSVCVCVCVCVCTSGKVTGSYLTRA